MSTVNSDIAPPPADVADHNPPWRLLLILGAATGTVCAALMLWVDVPVAMYMHQFADTRFTAIFAVVTNLANSAIWYCLALAAMGYALVEGRRATSPESALLLHKRLRAWSFLIISMVISGLLANGIKLIVGRDRPTALFGEGGTATFHPFAETLTSWSFPSGHAQSIWAAMIALSWIYPPVRTAGFCVAIAVSASRVIIGVHFLSDIIGGAYLAFAVAILLRPAFERKGITLDLSQKGHAARG